MRLVALFLFLSFVPLPLYNAHAVEVPSNLDELLTDANIGMGKRKASACKGCHTLGKGEKHSVGPNLWNIVGRKIGATEGYKYSDAMSTKGGNWEVKELYQFLNNPRWYVQGTNMTFVGVHKKQHIINVIAYLQTLKDE